ncbi:hypothetical protein V8E52_008932 [Russula decolorans]
MVRTKPLTIVIKLGTSSIVHETTHQPLLSTLSAIVETVVRLRAAGHKVVLDSSGAIGVGLQRMSMPARPKSLSGKQALAAIGQGRLIALWDNLFGQLGQPIAQVLLTRGDISDVLCLNAVNTIKELLSMGVVPIANENETVSVSEIKFGDDGTLSAITSGSSTIHADYLFLFTDVDGLYTTNPRKDSSARLIEVVESTSAICTQVSTATLGSNLGTGGMETKLIAAEIATAAGVSTITTPSRHPASLFAILEYQGATSGSGSSGTNPITRPLHTLFKPSATPLRDLKAWTRHTLAPAAPVLSRRESGGRLPAAGVLSVRGAFASGQAVRILVRKKASGAISEDIEAAREEYVRGLAPTQAGHQLRLTYLEDAVLVEKDVVDDGRWEVEEVGRGLANYNSAQVDKVKGLNRCVTPSSALPLIDLLRFRGYLSQLLGYADTAHVVENVTSLSGICSEQTYGMTKKLLKIENSLRYQAQLLYFPSSTRNFILSYLVHHTMLHGNSVKLLTGNSHPELAAAVAERLGTPLTPCTVTKFSNGEVNVKISESVRDEDVFIIQSACRDVNDHLMELLILISACKGASARRTTAVVPCYPYARMDKKDMSRAPITAKLVANMLAVAGCDHVITMDLHASQIQGFFDFPVDNLYSEPLLLSHIKLHIPGWEDAIIVSPDAGGAKRVTAIADKLGLEFALFHRKRDGKAQDAPEKMELLVGDVKGKVAILVDDMIDTGSTLALAARSLKENGASRTYALVSHGLFSEVSMSVIENLPLETLVVTNTVPQREHQKGCTKLVTLDISATIAESIRRTHNGESISLLFGDWVGVGMNGF